MRRHARGMLVSVLAAASLLLVLAPSAFAARTSVNTIGTEASGTTGGLFNTPRGVAVNNTGNGGVAVGTTYVVDSGNARVQVFTPSGAFARTWGAGVRTGSNEYELCASAASCRSGVASAVAGGFFSLQGIAVDQATGNVFVSDQGDRRISVFSASGAFEGAFGWSALDGSAALQFCTTGSGCHGPAAAPSGETVGLGQFGTAMGGLAVDASGNVYLADMTSRRVDVFKPLLTGKVVTGVEALRSFGWGAENGGEEFQVCATASCHTAGTAGTGAGQFATNSPSALAIDSEGNVFALDAGNKRVQEFSSTPAVLSAGFGATALTEAFGTGTLYSLAVEPGTDHLFVAGGRSTAGNKAAVLETDHAGAEVEVAGEDLSATAATGLGVAKASLGGYLYLASNASGQRVYLLGEGPAVAAPSAVTASTAMLHGTVASNSLDANYHFEYTADGTNWTKVPVSDVTVPAQAGSVAVEQEVSGLKPSTAYTVRLVETRPGTGPQAISATEAFFTAGLAPAIEGDFASQLTPTGARLVGYLNPENLPTTYQFEYGTTTGYGSTVPAAPESAGSGLGPVYLTQVLTGLTQGATYHFRLVATNAEGTTNGTDVEFTTPASAPAPNGRVYELVSPADKGGDEVFPETSGGFFTPISSTSGNSAAWISLDAPAGANPTSNGVFNFFRSDRTAGGWTTEELGSVIGPIFGLNTQEVKAFTPDLSKYVQIGPSTPQPGSGANEHALNVWVKDGTGYHLLTPGLAENTETFAEIEGYSEDFSHVVFLMPEALNGETPVGVGPILYDWNAATEEVKAVGWLPGSPEEISSGPVTIANPLENNGGSAAHWNPVSSDGSRIFFYTLLDQQLYLRIDGTETQHLSASQRTPVDPLGPKPATFRVATPDGSLAFFTSAEKLTNDATTGPSDGGSDLYRYDVATEALTDLTVDVEASDANGAEVEGVLGAADDGSRVYFVAKGVLAAGATAGAENLYVWHDDGSASGEIKFIATGVPRPNWVIQYPSPVGEHVVGRVAPNGNSVLFESPANVTGYQSGGHYEAYLYDAVTGKLVCASCNPSGAPATTDAIAAGTGDAPNLARTLSEDGSRVFFWTKERLLEGDTNSVADAYEYDVTTGDLALISSGKGPDPSYFSDSSPDGKNAFFVTRDRLVGIDQDESYDAYDARIGGGIPSQNPAEAPLPCEGQECRGPGAEAPAASSPASSTLNGPPNPKPQRKQSNHHKKHKKKHHGKKKRTNGNGKRHGRR